jgi:hypothetical protein
MTAKREVHRREWPESRVQGDAAEELPVPPPDVIEAPCTAICPGCDATLGRDLTTTDLGSRGGRFRVGDRVESAREEEVRFMIVHSWCESCGIRGDWECWLRGGVLESVALVRTYNWRERLLEAQGRADG